MPRTCWRRASILWPGCKNMERPRRSTRTRLRELPNTMCSWPSGSSSAKRLRRAARRLPANRRVHALEAGRLLAHRSGPGSEEARVRAGFVRADFLALRRLFPAPRALRHVRHLRRHRIHQAGMDQPQSDPRVGECPHDHPAAAPRQRTSSMYRRSRRYSPSSTPGRCWRCSSRELSASAVLVDPDSAARRRPAVPSRNCSIRRGLAARIGRLASRPMISRVLEAEEIERELGAARSRRPGDGGRRWAERCVDPIGWSRSLPVNGRRRSQTAAMKLGFLQLAFIRTARCGYRSSRRFPSWHDDVVRGAELDLGSRLLDRTTR